ncbi:helix-turn-helix transcriptional regulator [Oscillibacter sp.]|uniref:helix-turn-helix domain-containing protein n=1 Tax=Oscillibacter sp. TaxID=1945593 RepID=UPI0028A0B2EC|nr:helix-turn-helix transcriptional regulator [Oscillibacter sp.]
MNIIGQRIKKIRELRGWTQKYLAQRAEIHEMLLQKYEYGTRNPREDQLKKIAEALLVHVNFLRDPAVLHTPDSLVYNLLEQYGDVELDWNDGVISVGIPATPSSNIFNQDLLKIKTARESGLTNDELKLWLINHYYGSMCFHGEMRYPELEVVPKLEAVSPTPKVTWQDKFIAVMGTERKLKTAVDNAYHDIVDNGTDERTKKILDKLLHDVQYLVDDDRSKYD